MTTNDEPQLGPAARLQPGDILGGRWTIQQRMTRSTHGTGGAFSVAYLAKDSRGNSGFVKAMDFHQGLTADDPAKEIQLMTETFNFEKAQTARTCIYGHLEEHHVIDPAVSHLEMDDNVPGREHELGRPRHAMSVMSALAL